MTSFFEPESAFLFDPSSQMEEAPSSFLSFSSFAALANIATSPWSPSPSWDSDSSHPEKTANNSSIKRKAKSYFPHFSDSDSAHSPSHSDGTDRSHALGSLEPVTPHLGPVVHFHESDAGSSRVNPASLSLPESFTSLRSSPPTLLSKESIESIATVVASSSSSSCNRKASATPSALRTASNPVLGSTYRRPVKPIASMPALNEEDSLGATDANLFDGLDMTDVFGTNGFADASKQISHDIVNDDVLAEDFEWVFGGYGLGGSATGSGSSSSSGSGSVASTGIVPAESTIFAAFQDGQASSSMLNVNGVDSTFYDSYHTAPTYTIDPMEFIGSMAMENGLAAGVSDCRPSSAPGVIGVGPGNMLSIPMGDMMSRSVSSDSMFSIHSAPSQDSYSYMSQSSLAGPSYSQPLYPANYSSVSPVDASIALPPTSPKSRRVSKPGLSIQIHPRDQMTTYRQSSNLLPPTPTSAPFTTDMTYQQHVQPLPMSRTGSHPLPTRRKASNGPAAQPAEVPMPPVVARAAAIVAMQEAKQEQQRQELRRQAASRRAGMTDASVLQPYMINSGVPHPSQISGWTGMTYPIYPAQAPPMAYAVSHPQPVVTVHPPPMQMYGSQGSHLTSQPLHRVHPPPHPGQSATASTSRPIARMPSTPTRTRKPSNSPSKRTPKKRSESATSASGAGGFSWGSATFINFTSDDADMLLGGVAPSGSQSKRKRDDEERMQEEELMGLGERKRSRS